PPGILKDLRARYSAFASDDAETRAAIAAVHKETGRIIDPHTAVGVAAARKLGSAPSPVVVLSTAHPAKFPDAVSQAIGAPPPEPRRLAGLKNLPEKLEILGHDPALIKQFISSRLAG
ncbi:MAG: threonine synthase, partial [Pseudomonadota bacterium]